MAREAAKSFKELIVWQKAHAFVLKVYGVTKGFPKSEVYGLTSQMRRAGVSIAANIAEGFRRRSASDKTRFLNIAQSSLEESRYYLILANDLEYCETSAMEEQIEEVSKLLDAYSKAVIRRSQESGDSRSNF